MGAKLILISHQKRKRRMISQKFRTCKRMERPATIQLQTGKNHWSRTNSQRVRNSQKRNSQKRHSQKRNQLTTSLQEISSQLSWRFWKMRDSENWSKRSLMRTNKRKLKIQEWRWQILLDQAQNKGNSMIQQKRENQSCKDLTSKYQPPSMMKMASLLEVAQGIEIYHICNLWKMRKKRIFSDLNKTYSLKR